MSLSPEQIEEIIARATQDLRDQITGLEERVQELEAQRLELLQNALEEGGDVSELYELIATAAMEHEGFINALAEQAISQELTADDLLKILEPETLAAEVFNQYMLSDTEVLAILKDNASELAREAIEQLISSYEVIDILKSSKALAKAAIDSIDPARIITLLVQNDSLRQQAIPLLRHILHQLETPTDSR